MKKKQVIEEIIILPKKFFNYENNKSISALLKETGYFEMHNEIKEDDILKVLLAHSNYVNHWLNWSADKRSSSGWYFKHGPNHNEYIVNYFPKNLKNEEMIYSNPKNACAAFIKREMETIRKIKP